MLTTNGVYSCCTYPCAGRLTNNVTTTIDNPGTIDLNSLPRNTARLKNLPDITSYTDLTSVARMKRLKNRKTNGASKMDLSKKRPTDYTELAYREAISKLKYLLTEFYAPIGISETKSQTIRSIYENSNLRINESGEDTDDQSVISGNFRKRDLTKKGVSSAFPLTSKNIRPAKAYSNIALSKADLSSLPPGLTSFIERQEDYIEQLERESQYCRDELIDLLSKVREVVAENEALHNKNQTIFSKCTLQNHKDCIGSDRDECREQDAIDHDVNKAESKKEKLMEGPSIMFESRISELEAQLTQAKLELRKAQEENRTNLKRLSENSSEGNAELKIELDKALRAKYEAEIKLEELQKLLSVARDKETEATQRAKRSMDDRQQIEFERNQDEIEIRRLKDELERQHDKLREASQEANRRITEERQQVERRYNQQIDQLSADIASHWETANKSQLEVEKQRREINELRRELSQKQMSMDNQKKELQNKISTLQSDLNQALSEKDSAEQEILTSKLAAERNERQARQEQSRLQTEINSYKQRLERADVDLVHCRRENLRLSEQIASLEKEISMSKITHGEDNRSQVTPRLENEKELTSMIMDMETKHEGVIERDVTTVGQSASPSSKKRTVKVDLKVKVIPKKKSNSSKMSLSAQEEMADLQSNIIHLSNKIQDTFVSHGGNLVETMDDASAAFHHNSMMESINPSCANGTAGSKNNSSDAQMINQGYETTSPNQKVADEESGVYSNASRGNDRSQDLYNLPGGEIRVMEENSIPHMMETTEMYRPQRDTCDNEEEYIGNDQNMDTYVEGQEYDQYGGYTQYQEEQYINGEQFNVAAEQIEDNQASPVATRPNNQTLH